MGSVSLQEAVVTATQGEDVRLPNCSAGLDRLELTKHTGAHSAQPMVILSRGPDYKASEFPDGKNVKWRADEKGDMSAFLTAVDRSDEGLYRCQKWKGWTVVLDQNITLKVKECNILDPVKVAIQGSNSSVTLHCPYDTTPGQNQAVSWAFLKGDKEDSIFDKEDKRLQAAGASLVISSVNDSDIGWYRCKYLVGQTQRCYDRRLTIQEALITVITTTTVFVSETPQVTPEATTQNVQEREGEVTGGESPSTSTTILVASVVTSVTVTIALVVGVAIYHKQNTQRRRLMHHSDLYIQAADSSYDNRFQQRASTSSRDLQMDSLYEDVGEEGLCTFQS